MSSSDARAFVCPICGAPNSEQARHCDYCRAPLATLGCARCFHMNEPGARHCSGCGAELGLEPIPEPSHIACPECRIPLRAYHEANGRLLDCERCGGQFVEHAFLKEMLTRSEALGRALPRRTKPGNPASQPIVYRPCPHCRALMQRKNFGGASGVIVDICALHGVWFDAGELPSVLAFVESGGLDRAQRAEAQQEHEKRVEQHLALSGSHALEGADWHTASGGHGWLEFLKHVLEGR